MRKTQMDREHRYYGLNLHMLDVLGKHHDEDLCILQAVHPVAGKAVRRAITSRLRRLSMGCDYDVSGSGPRMSVLLLTGSFQTVKCDSKLNGESHEYANRVGGNHLPDDTTERAQTLDIHVCEITQTMKAAPRSQAQQARESQRRYCYHRSHRRNSKPHNRDQISRRLAPPGYAIDKGGLHYQPDADVGPVEGTYSDTVRR